MSRKGLIPDPRNARRHPQRNQDLIRQSLEEVGPFRSIGVDGEGIIRAGNGVYEQAQALGLKVREVEAAPDELIAVVRPDLKGEKAQRAALLDNRTGETSEWDSEVLKELAEETDLSDLFTEEELDKIIGTETTDDEVSMDGREHYLVIVCKREAEQVELLERLTTEGFECRALVS
jgi:hypothetical protein